MISLICESKEQNKQTKQKQIHRYREQTKGCQMRGAGGLNIQSEGIKNYKLVVTQ